MWRPDVRGAAARLRKSVDLRFSDAAAEAEFKSSLEPELVRATLYAGIVALIGFTCVDLLDYLYEGLRADSPFAWGANDSRTLYYAVGAVNTATLVVVIVACLLRTRCDRLKCLNWEVVTTGAVVSLIWFPTTPWHTARMFGADPASVWQHDTTSGEMLFTMMRIVTQMIVCMYLPIRTGIVLIVPLVTSCSHVLTVIAVGSPFPEDVMATATLVSAFNIFSVTSASRREQQIRQTWLARQEVHEQGLVARALHVMAGTLCDIVVHLDANACVFEPNAMHDTFFGQAAEGLELSSLIAEGDRKHFDTLLKMASASQALESMPVRLELPLTVCTAQLSLIRTQGRSTHFLVGFSQCEHQPRLSVQTPQLVDALPTIAEDQVAFGPEQQETGTAGDVTSVPSTSFSDAVFKDIDRLALDPSGSGEMSVRKALQDVAEVGVREHWLVGSSEVSLVPQVILGQGGFGTVCVGILRGSAVAVKLPRKKATTKETLQKLSSFCSELQIHRRIRHRHIVAFHGAIIEPSSGELALIFEFVKGECMHSYIQNMVPGEDVLVRVKLIFDVSSALTYLHSLEPTVVHGDIKGSNIMVEQLKVGAQAKLLDLGLSRRLTKRAKPLGGTRTWTAPELHSNHPGAKKPQPMADVFSFGLLAYFSMTGKMFPNNVEFPEYKWAPGMPVQEQCLDLCKRCLRRDPDLRPPMTAAKDVILQWFLCFPKEEIPHTFLGKDVGAMLFGGLDWEEGVAKIEANLASAGGVASMPASEGGPGVPAPGDHLQTAGSQKAKGQLMNL